MRATPLFLLLAATAAFAMLAVANASAAPAPCGVEVSVDATSLYARVTSSAAGAATTTGSVTVTLPPLSRAVVTLTATVSTGWPVSLSPTSITISDPVNGAAFTFTGVVPPATLAETVGTATITASMIVSGYQCPPSQAQLTITPLPYFDELSARISTDALTIHEGGGPGKAWIFITAKVNTPIVLELTYVGPASVTFASARFSNLQPNASSVVTANVSLSASSHTLTAGVYQMFINVSAGTEDGLSKSGTLLVPLVVEPPPSIAVADVAVPVGAAVAVGVAASILWRRRQAGRTERSRSGKGALASAMTNDPPTQ